MVRLLSWFARTLFLATSVFLSSFSFDPLVPSDPAMRAMLAPPAELAVPATEASSPVLPPRQAVWGYFYPAWAEDARPLKVADGIDLKIFAHDPEKRLEPEFQVPRERWDVVLFWASVYSEYTSKMKVIHDRNNPALVYGYIDFTPLYGRMSYMGAAITSERIEANVLANLTASLMRAGGQRGPRTLPAQSERRFRDYLAAHGVRGHKAVRELLDNLRSQTGQADGFQNALGRSRAMLARIESVFRNHGLPRALARIPFVESSFNTEARSKVGAIGLWQFIPSTARAMIHAVDESKWSDPARQTEAAAILLKQYRRALPDWESVVTSYNSGIGRVSRLLRSSKSQGLQSGLGFAGRNYFAELLAANLVEAYREEIFTPTTLEQKRQALQAEVASRAGGECWMPVAESTAPVADSGIEAPSDLKEAFQAVIEENRLRANRWIGRQLARYEQWVNGGASRTQFAAID